MCKITFSIVLQQEPININSEDLFEDYYGQHKTSLREFYTKVNRTKQDNRGQFNRLNSVVSE
jgi:hypothetical protein